MNVHVKLGCGCCTDELVFDTIDSTEEAFHGVGLESCATIVDDSGETHEEVDTFYGFSLDAKEQEGRGLQFLADQAFGSQVFVGAEETFAEAPGSKQWLTAANAPNLAIKLQGDRNPARVAHSWMTAYLQGDMIDHVSFRETAISVGDIDDKIDGFVVAGVADLERLCLLGRFEIVVNKSGKVSARLARSRDD